MTHLTRRKFVQAGAAVAVAGAWRSAIADEPPKKTEMGIVTYCLGIRSRADRAAGRQPGFTDPMNFLEHCHTLGAGGIQLSIGIKDEPYTTKLRREAERRGMFVEGIMNLPRDETDVERFDAEVRTAKQAGITVVRVVMMPGRRYEQFGTAEEFREFAQRGLKSLELAEPIAAKHRVHLALENHKGQRIGERLEVLKHLSSEYVGACVDVGNSFALMEDPIEVVESYAPWAMTVHLKDQAVHEVDDGFLLADAVLGDGFLDLPRMVAILRRANPSIHFCLETITRDPLTVPCLTDKYWATFGDVPGRDLARTLRIVRAGDTKSLPRISHLPLEEQVAIEATNVERCLAYARTIGV